MYLTDDPDFTEAIDYGSLIKQYLFWNMAKLIDGNLEGLIDHPLLKVIKTRREIENPLGFDYAKSSLTEISVPEDRQKNGDRVSVDTRDTQRMVSPDLLDTYFRG